MLLFPPRTRVCYFLVRFLCGCGSKKAIQCGLVLASLVLLGFQSSVLSDTGSMIIHLEVVRILHGQGFGFDCQFHHTCIQQMKKGILGGCVQSLGGCLSRATNPNVQSRNGHYHCFQQQFDQWGWHSCFSLIGQMFHEVKKGSRNFGKVGPALYAFQFLLDILPCRRWF